MKHHLWNLITVCTAITSAAVLLYCKYPLFAQLEQPWSSRGMCVNWNKL